MHGIIDSQAVSERPVISLRRVRAGLRLDSDPLMSHPRLVTTPSRSALMSRIRGADTKPEILVRQTLHSLGFRFRIHVRTLPGWPDIVLRRYRLIIQVKGCFWHSHSCRDGKVPNTNVEYWIPKLLRNQKRDLSNERKLRRLGWSVHSLWECRLCRCSPSSLKELLLKIIER
ncbi:MAG: very short patch repair endonuclease [Terracidiphilus sp.]|jgi:DNA mismatch endonuclease (patch repair protein)